jgi:DNA-binding XRE family transcriptional regulator
MAKSVAEMAEILGVTEAQVKRDREKQAKKGQQMMRENITRRQEYNMTQQEMADAIGVTRKTIYRWETNNLLKFQEKYRRLILNKVEGVVTRPNRQPMVFVSPIKPSESEAVEYDTWYKKENGLIAGYRFDGTEWILMEVAR